MPRRIKPRLGWSYPSIRLGVPDEHVKASYSPAFLAGIAAEFEIPARALDRFQDTVLRAGALYKQTKAVREDRPTPVQVSEHHKGTEYHASVLLDCLANMDDASWNSFWRAEDDLIEECIFGGSSAMQKIGAHWQTDRLEDAWEFYTSADAPPVLRLIRLICERARANMGAPRRGPKRRVALRRWAAKVLDFWEGELRQAVTIDYQAGQASSRTYRFLERLLTPLDPSAVRSLATVLREEPTRRRRDN
jgi:hypothetical protein